MLPVPVRTVLQSVPLQLPWLTGFSIAPSCGTCRHPVVHTMGVSCKKVAVRRNLRMHYLGTDCQRIRTFLPVIFSRFSQKRRIASG
jgi:hypothetical protein